jgi:hypothetical protein
MPLFVAYLPLSVEISKEQKSGVVIICGRISNPLNAVQVA